MAKYQISGFPSMGWDRKGGVDMGNFSNHSVYLNSKMKLEPNNPWTVFPPHPVSLGFWPSHLQYVPAIRVYVKLVACHARIYP